jgi:carbon monoxide dehydrogenase subunit G
VPGCEKVEILGPTTYLAEVKVKLGPIKAEFRLNVEVTKETPPEEVLSITKGEEGSKASLVQAKNILRLHFVMRGNGVSKFMDFWIPIHPGFCGSA